jgi:hypothetical protein
MEGGGGSTGEPEAGSALGLSPGYQGGRVAVEPRDRAAHGNRCLQQYGLLLDGRRRTVRERDGSSELPSVVAVWRLGFSSSRG